MIVFEATTFEMGCTSGSDCGADAQPMHSVPLSTFRIQRYEVTQAQYAACSSCTPIAGSSAELPASGMDWADASAYCTSISLQLPTEAQWEYAARGSDERPYPWGSATPSCALAQFAGCGSGEPIGETADPDGQTPQAVQQLAGNVREWTLDYYDANFYGSASATMLDAQNTHSAGDRVVRGGSFRTGSASLSTWARDSHDQTQNHGSDDIGIRCAGTGNGS
jgi:formylglycine-generating enzyme